MAQEEKKPDENLKTEEPNKTDLDKNEKKEEAKEEEKKVEDSKLEQASVPVPVVVPQEIILKVFMHCEGCARKVRRCLKGFQGVESVETDCKAHKVVVKGDKADPLQVLQRLQKKSHRQIELISPIPLPLPLPLPTPDIQNPKTEEIKPEIITVVLKVHMHCEACAQEIKRRILKMKGVETVEADLKSSLVTVNGAIDPPTLAQYVYKRTGKHALIVNQHPQPQPQPDENANGPIDTVKKDDKSEENEKKVDDHEKAVGDKGEVEVEGEAKTEEATDKAKAKTTTTTEEEVSKVVQVEMEMKKNEYYYQQYYNFNYPQSYIMEMYAYPPDQNIIAAADDYPPPMVGVSYPPPPQMFSDENPNACSVM